MFVETMVNFNDTICESSCKTGNSYTNFIYLVHIIFHMNGTTRTFLSEKEGGMLISTLNLHCKHEIRYGEKDGFRSK